MRSKEQIFNKISLKEERKKLRNNPTPEEKKLWQYLKGSQLGYKIRRQHSIGNYIVDFYAASEKVVIELDGAQHYTKEGKEQDEIRDEYLNSIGIRVLRFENRRIKQDIQTVLKEIKNTLTTPVFQTIPPFKEGNTRGGLKEKDLQYIWHPFNHKGTEIVPIVKAEGAYVFGEDGKKYIDGFSSWWVNMHGHCHPYIAKKISEQVLELEHVAFGGFTHPQAVKLAERLVNLLPDKIDKIFFSDNGSTANEVALKMAIQYWFNQEEERNKFITFTNDYHGDTFGSMSLTARGGFNEPFERFLFDVEFVDTPNSENRIELLSQLEELLKSNDVAAFIFEPIVQGAAGMLKHSPKILSEMIGLCKKYNVITIADEVLTGFYRTGKFFSSDYLENKPDIICLSKGVTGGFMTMGVTAVTNKIFKAFDSENKKHTFLHGHSYTGNALACAAANASLDLFEKKETIQNIQRIVKQQSAFISSIKNHPKLRDARNFGTIAAIELDTEGESNYFNSKGNDAYKWFMDKGIILRPLGNVLIMIPPYCIKEEDLNYIYQEIKNFLK